MKEEDIVNYSPEGQEIVPGFFFAHLFGGQVTVEGLISQEVIQKDPYHSCKLFIEILWHEKLLNWVDPDVISMVDLISVIPVQEVLQSDLHVVLFDDIGDKKLFSLDFVLHSSEENSE